MSQDLGLCQQRGWCPSDNALHKRKASNCSKYMRLSTNVIIPVAVWGAIIGSYNVLHDHFVFTSCNPWFYLLVTCKL
jgi:hypothetical protein